MAEKVSKLSGVVLRKGLKYFTIRPDPFPQLKTKTAWLIRNDVTEQLDAGDYFSFDVKVHYKLKNGATQYEISYFEALSAKTHINTASQMSKYKPDAVKTAANTGSQDEIDKEYYWLIQNYDNGNGFVNEKRLQRLRDMGAFDKLKQFAELRKNYKEKEVINEKARWFGYVKDHFFKDGYVYTKGIEKLKALGAKEELAQIDEWIKSGQNK